MTESGGKVMCHRKIIEYKLVELQEAKAFRESASFQLKKNYQPYGYPHISDNLFRQIWVKYAEESNVR